MRELMRCHDSRSGFLILADKSVSAFVHAVDKEFGAEKAHQSALDWIEELGTHGLASRGNRFRIGAGLRWEQVRGLALYFGSDIGQLQNGNHRVRHRAAAVKRED